MAVEMTTFDLSFSTSGNTDVVDLTHQVLDRVAETNLEDGQVLLFVPGSTGAITTIEYEHGAVSDLKEAIENLAPEGKYYRHNERWGCKLHELTRLYNKYLDSPITFSSATIYESSGGNAACR